MISERQDTKDLNNAKDQARELERQLNELKNKNGGNKNLWIGVVSGIIASLLISLVFYIYHLYFH